MYSRAWASSGNEYRAVSGPTSWSLNLLREVDAWLAPYAAAWDERLERLRTHLDGDAHRDEHCHEQGDEQGDEHGDRDDD